jgi:BASS family bile acid:Na+ symporter
MSVKQLLLDLPNWLIFAFVVVNMLALGMELTIAEVVTPLRDVRLTVKALVANFVLVPLTAYALVNGLRLEHGFALGLILLACSAGDPFVTKLSQSARGDMAFSLAVMALLSIVTCAYMPVVLPLLLPGIKVDPVEIVKPLVVLILIPLIIGLVVRAKAPKAAERLAPPFDKFASFLIYAAVALFAVVHYADIAAAFGMHAILAATVLVAAAAFFGYLLGGPAQQHRGDLAVNTAWRGVSAGLAVGIKNFPTEHNMFTMAIIIVLVSAATLMPLSSTYLRRRNLADSSGVNQQVSQAES